MYIGSLGFFLCTFSIPFRFRASALHSSPSYLALDRLISSTSSHRSSPSPSSRSTSRTSILLSKFSPPSRTQLVSLHRRAVCRQEDIFTLFPLLYPVFLRSRLVEVFVLVVSSLRIKTLASGLVKGQATVAHFSSFFLRPTQRTAGRSVTQEATVAHFLHLLSFSACSFSSHPIDN